VTPASVTVSGDNVSYGPVSATPTAVGKYTFVAQYINPTTNTLAAGPSSCPPSATDGDEEVTVANSSIETTPQAGGGGAIPATIGTSARVDVRDHAVISVTGTQAAFAGTVKFFLCGPLAANTTENCSTGGVQIGSPATGETVSGAAGTANLNSDTATLTSAGRYCWRAEYSGDSTVGIPASKDPSKSVATGGTTSECFTIAPVQPILTTAASDDVTLGTSITDTASLTGTAKQPGTGGLGGAETIAAAASGIGQEVFNAAILFAAVAMLGWHNVWMTQHGRAMTMDMTIAAWNPPRSYSLRGIGAGIEFTSEIRCVPDGASGTRLEMEVVGRPLNLAAKIFSPLLSLMSSVMVKQCAKDLADIAAAAERSGDAAGAVGMRA
jgi:hypothetical protein